MAKTQKHFKVKWPGSFYAEDAYGTSVADVRTKLRGDRKRLPKGVEVWEFTEQDERIVRESQDKMARDYRKAGQIADF